MALVAGNGVVLKPSEHAPLVAEPFRFCLRRGWPAGRLAAPGPRRGCDRSGDLRRTLDRQGLLHGRRRERLRVKQIADEHGKPVILELGGKDAAIVCHDADLDRAVAGTLCPGWPGPARPAPQAERVYVDRRIHDEYVERLVQAAAQVDEPPIDPRSQIGSMISEAQYERVMAQIDEAAAAGGHIRSGDPRRGSSGRFIAPVVLTGVDHGMPVMPTRRSGRSSGHGLRRRGRGDSAGERSSHGLGASVWSRTSPGPGGSQSDRCRDGLDQRPRVVGRCRAGALGRFEGVRPGCRASKFGLYEMVEKRLISEDHGLLPVA